MDFTLMLKGMVDATSIQTQLSKLKPTITVTTNLKGGGVKELTTFKDELGNTYKVANEFNAKGESLGSTLKSVSEKAGTASTAVGRLGQDFLDTTGKVLKFAASTAVIGAFVGAVHEGVEAVKGFDASLIELQKVSDLSKDSLDGFVKEAFDMAEDLSTTATNVTDAITEFSKSGYSMEDAQSLAEPAIMFQTIADEAISASDSATMLIQTMKAYDMKISESTHIIDAVNEVSNNFSVSSSDLSQSIGKVASSADMAGVSFEQLLGMMVASNEVVQNSSKVANGYKTILTNLMTKDLEEQFNEFGLSMRDANGQMKDGYTIIQELGEVYRSLGETWDEDSESMISLSDKMNVLLKDIAGSHRINVLVAGMNNFEQGIKATETALNSAGSASTEYEKSLDGIEKKTDALKGQFLELVWGDGGVNNLIKLFLDLGTTLLKVANSDIGQFIVKAGLMIGAYKGVTEVLKTLKGLDFVSNLVTQFTTAARASFGFGQNVSGLVASLSAGFSGLAGVISANLPLFTAMAFAGLYAILEKISSRLDEQKRLVKELAGETNQLASEQEILNQKRMEGTITDQEKERLNLLNAEIEANKTILAQEAQKQFDMGYAETSETQGKAFESGTRQSLGTLEMDIASFERLGEKIRDLREEQEELDKTTLDGAESYKRLDSEIKDLGVTQAKLSKRLTTTAQELKDIQDLGADIGEFEGLADKIEKISGAYAEEADEARNAAEETVNTRESFASLESQLASLSGVSLNDLTNAFDTLRTAQEEMANSGYMTLDTFDALMSMSPELTAMLLNNVGALDTNTNAEMALYQAKVMQMGVTAARAQIELASTRVSEQGAGAYANLGVQAVGAANSVWELVKAEFAETVANKKMSSSDAKALESNIRAISAWADSAKAGIQATNYSTRAVGGNTGAVGGNTGAQRGNSSARNANTDAIKAQTEALKAQKAVLEDMAEELESEIKDYETVIDYVKDMIKEEKQAVEDEKDAILKAIQDEIDALEKEKDAFNDRVDSDINNINILIEATENKYDMEINKLKEVQNERERDMRLQQLQQNLALAYQKKNMIFKGGRFVYEADYNEISKAEQELADYELELKAEQQIRDLEKLKEQAINALTKQLDDLEKFKEDTNKNYEEQLQNLKTHYDNMEAEYDKRIKEYDAILKKFEDMLNARAKAHAKILYDELVGEQKNWDDRIAALQKFVNNFDAKKAQLDGIKNQINNITKQIQGLEASARNSVNTLNALNNQAQNSLAGINGALSSARASVQELNNEWLAVQVKGWQGQVYNPSFGTWMYTAKQATYEGAKAATDGLIQLIRNTNSISQWKDIDSRIVQVNRWATGNYSIRDDQIALVGDNPNFKELVIGSKLNKNAGVPLSLKKGTGVVPAKETNTLTRTLTSYARGIVEGDVQNTSMSDSSQTIYIDRMVLENVNSPDDLANALATRFKSYATQSV